MAAAPDWLAHLPSGATFVTWSLVGIVATAVLRLVAGRTHAGRRVFVILHGVESGFLALLLAVMLALAFLQIVLRNVAHSGLTWVDPLLRHLLLWIGFAGAALATRLDRHIHMDVLTRMLPPAANRIARRTTYAGAAFVCLLLADAASRLVVQEARAETTNFLDLPTWILQLVMPLACLIMSYRFVHHLIDPAREKPAADVTARPERVA